MDANGLQETNRMKWQLAAGGFCVGMTITMNSPDDESPATTP